MRWIAKPILWVFTCAIPVFIAACYGAYMEFGDSGPDANTGTDTDSDTDSDMDSDTDSDTDTQTDSDTDPDAGPDSGIGTTDGGL